MNREQLQTRGNHVYEPRPSVRWTNSLTDTHLKLRRGSVTQIFDEVKVNQSNNKVPTSLSYVIQLRVHGVTNAARGWSGTAFTGLENSPLKV